MFSSSLTQIVNYNLNRIVSIAKSAFTNDKLHISKFNTNCVLIELTPVNSRGVRDASYLTAYGHFRNCIYLEDRYLFYHCDKRLRN